MAHPLTKGRWLSKFVTRTASPFLYPVMKNQIPVRQKQEVAASRIPIATLTGWVMMRSTTDKSQNIKTVKYCDFKLLKKNIKGVECKKLINLDKFDKGTPYSKVEDEIDIDPYSITYANDLVTYRYRYWYDSDSGDEQQVVLDVSFDGDNKFLYYTSTMVYPEHL